MRRLLATELMDDDSASADPAEWRRTLDDLSRINAALGGRRLLRREIDRLPRPPRTILDVCTGGADLPIFLLDCVRARAAGATCVALDRSERVLAVAEDRLRGRSDIRIVRGDARALPFDDGAFDLATMTLALHHFDGDDAVRVLREMARVARDVIVNDLRRSPIAWAAARFGFPLFTRNRFILHDGPISALRAYTPEEARSIARQAGWTRVEVRTHPGYRMAIVGGKA